MASTAALKPAGSSGFFTGVAHRQLDRYPGNAARMGYLGISVMVTVILYYELYIQGAVSTQITASYHMSFNYLVTVVVVGNAVGALASFGAGLADRFGRAQLVVAGVLVASLITAFALPNANSKGEYMFFYALLGVVEGMALVATPALIRDFSPQLGRAAAMGFWTLGPVLGSLVTTEVSSNTLANHPHWEFQFHVAGGAGLVVTALAFLFVRELSPQLRDQLMVSINDRALIEARAAGIDTKAAEKNGLRQMLHVDVVVPAAAISIFLLFYYVLVAFFVVYLATVFGYSTQKANALANWYWISNAIALVVAGGLSDKLRVRKPFMVVGGAVSAVTLAIFAAGSTDTSTGYYTLATLLVIIAASSGIAYVAWMAAFTETVEKHNPAGTATGLALWGMILRAVVAIGFLVLPHVISAANPLVNDGAKATTLSTEYKTQLATLGKLTPATAAALTRNPADLAAQAAAVAEIAGGGTTAADVARASTLSATYKTQLATLAKLTPATAAALQANPSNPATQAEAVAEIAGNGTTAADVAKAETLSAQYKSQLATAEAVDLGTLATLAANPTDPTAGASAVAQVVTKLHVTPAVAQADLVALSKVPQADTQFLLTSGPAIQTAAADLTATAAVPASDLSFLSTDGTKIATAGAALKTASTVPAADLQFLQTKGVAVAAAAKKNPGEWQTWWWICFAGQILFLPAVWLLTGRWSPRKAKADADAHAMAVERELAAMAEAGTVTLPSPRPRSEQTIDLTEGSRHGLHLRHRSRK